MDANGDPRVVLVHDWLTGMRGGEKCLEVLCERWPNAPLLTLLHRPGSISPVIEQRPIQTSLFQRLPAVHRYYRYLLPFMPATVARFQVPSCDLVVSFSHCVAKSVPPPPGTPHVCYCFTPMRYAWHMRQSYFSQERLGRLKARAIDRLMQRLRDWDRRTAGHVTHFIAISRTVQQRIRECYGRESTVIYPPVNTDFYCPSSEPREDFYLMVSAFAPYKRLDLAVAACKQMRRPLRIIGTGQDEKRLRALAGPTISFLGWQPDTVIREQMRRCRALLFPGEEDFGIVPLEAHACGTPVIAFGRGGASETVISPDNSREPTGVWFMEQTVAGLIDALQSFEANARQFDPAVARRQALRFNQERFAKELFAYLDGILRPDQADVRRAA